MMWFDAAVQAIGLCLALGMLWGLLAMVRVRRRVAWWGMFFVTGAFLLLRLLALLALFLPSLAPGGKWMADGLAPFVAWLPPVFTLCFALHAWRLRGLVSGTRRLEEECAALAERLEQKRQGVSFAASSPDLPQL